MNRALVTGASGFIGSRLCEDLLRSGWQVYGCVRGADRELPKGVVPVQIEDLSSLQLAQTTVELSDIDVIYHLAARAHRLEETGDESTAALYESDNVAATQVAYRWAQKLAVPHMVFLSSIKVLGETSAQPLTFDSPYRPEDSYARSKMAAEQFLLRATSVAAPMLSPVVTILRPPLVYGPGVKGNFARLLEATQSVWPLPLGRARAKRSMIFLGNLTDLLVRCATSRPKSCEIYHIRDTQELSVSELVGSVAYLMKKRKMLLPVPESLMRLLASVSGQRGSFERLFRPLRVDDRRTRQVFEWSAPVAVSDALKETVDAWKMHE